MPKIAEKCQEWLNQSPADRNLEAGAMLMLQANRNRILYSNVISRRNFDRIEYELKKYVKENPELPSEKVIEITNLEHKLAKQTNQFANENKGLRADHDKLPESIQNLVEINRENYHLLRSAHEKLKFLSGQAYNAEQRKPVVEQVLSLNEKIRKNWEKYDSFDVNAQPEPEAPKANTGNNIDFKTVNANKVYLSRLPGQIEKMKLKGKNMEAEALVKEARRRYSELLNAGVTFKPEMIEKLKKTGVIE